MQNSQNYAISVAFRCRSVTRFTCWSNFRLVPYHKIKRLNCQWSPVVDIMLFSIKRVSVSADAIFVYALNYNFVKLSTFHLTHSFCLLHFHSFCVCARNYRWCCSSFFPFVSFNLSRCNFEYWFFENSHVILKRATESTSSAPSKKFN